MYAVRKVGVFLGTWLLAPEKEGDEKAYIIKRSVSAHRATLVEIILLADNRGDTTCTEARSTFANKFGQCFKELALGKRGVQREEVAEDADDHKQFICRVTLHEREEGSLEHVWRLKLVGVLTQEKNTFVDEVAEYESQNLAKVSARNKFLGVVYERAEQCVR